MSVPRHRAELNYKTAVIDELGGWWRGATQERPKGSGRECSHTGTFRQRRGAKNGTPTYPPVGKKEKRGTYIWETLISLKLGETRKNPNEAYPSLVQPGRKSQRKEAL